MNGSRSAMGRTGALLLLCAPAAGEVAVRLAGPADAAIIVPVFVNGRGPLDFEREVLILAEP